MPKIEALEVIDLTNSTNDEQQYDQIRALSQRVLTQEIPAYQVDIGDNIAGMFVVRSLIEAEVNDRHGATLADKGLPRWAMTHETVFARYARSEHHTVANTLAPHRDRSFHGLAMHRNYLSYKPVPVQFGFSNAEIINDDPSFSTIQHYTGSRTVADYTDTVWEGETKTGRITVFSQGNGADDLFGMQSAIHFFDRRDHPWKGIYTRYACPDLTNTDWEGVPYDDFVAMRSHASRHLEYARWDRMATNLSENRHKTPPRAYDEMYQRVEAQLTESKHDANFQFWSLYNGVKDEISARFSYGVFSPEYSETSVIDPYILKIPGQ